MTVTDVRADQESVILVNGVARNEVSALDRGLAYGDGVFRTLLALRGTPLHWPLHYAKLARDCATLGLSVPDAHVLEAEVKAVCRFAARCAVKIIVTRGAARRGYRYDGGEQPTRIVYGEARDDSGGEERTVGARVRLCSTRLAPQPALAGVKHLNRLENVLARAEWCDPGIAEGLMCDVEGSVVGGTMTNLFIVSHGALATPRLDACGVAGVTRERVIAAAGRMGVPCAVATLGMNDVLRADEIFAVNSLVGIWPVRELDGATRTPGCVTRALQAALEHEDAAQMA